MERRPGRKLLGTNSDSSRTKNAVLQWLASQPCCSCCTERSATWGATICSGRRASAAVCTDTLVRLRAEGGSAAHPGSNSSSGGGRVVRARRQRTKADSVQSWESQDASEEAEELGPAGVEASKTCAALKVTDVHLAEQVACLPDAAAACQHGHAEVAATQLLLHQAPAIFLCVNNLPRTSIRDTLPRPQSTAPSLDTTNPKDTRTSCHWLPQAAPACPAQWQLALCAQLLSRGWTRSTHAVQ